MLNDSEILIDDFDYKILEQQIHSDLFMIKHYKNHTDTLFSFSNMTIAVNLIDVLFSNHLNIDHLYIDSVKIHIMESDQDYQNSIQSILSKISLFSQDVKLSNLTLHDLTIKYKQYSLENISLQTDEFRINKDYLDIVDIRLFQGSSLMHANCQ